MGDSHVFEFFTDASVLFINLFQVRASLHPARMLILMFSPF